MLEIRCSESEAVLRMRGMPSFCITAQRTPGEGWSKLMEDLTDLRKVLPKASGAAGFFWNSLSFDCFPIVCSQTGRLKKAAETGRPQINIYLPNVRGEKRCTLLPVAGDVDNPMLSRSLLFIMSLVLRGGIRIIYNGSTDTAVFAIVNNPSVGGIG